ncbi:helix-turn-helix transcriptional regulator [Burkholderia seminalis]|uniref:Transcriptional regulator n=1 Tax=Burkholderia cenocepacia TaxID=95486 RepID=A0A071M589_9BURK|nr:MULTISPECIES: helix-turn-helix domain-containing protein [Burkholderia]MBN3740733.1 helix-turn-helix transcriptional regulator [Burkholderia sp. Tr-20355]MCA8427387.1 helix-turn-helix transcriptional regulator [Burkholderia seminalis]MCA8434481.1 helix-turn-helix transcriptional regulator [Burkholderia seminalis]QTO24136.1 helix-turn-helix transcriptional regulator [Burkholderia seminalis]RQS74771.1 transcriptional regulator [Burkholderia seminalis]
MHGVTQPMLTRTLRQLERDGLVLRHDFDEVPARVEYELSDMGMDLLVRVVPPWTWIAENADRFREARRIFDNHHRDANS